MFWSHPLMCNDNHVRILPVRDVDKLYISRSIRKTTGQVRRSRDDKGLLVGAGQRPGWLTKSHEAPKFCNYQIAKELLLRYVFL